MKEHIEAEILETEKNYAEGLQYVLDTFAAPIKNSIVSTTKTSSLATPSHPILSIEKYDFLFSEIPKLIAFSHRLTGDIEINGLARAFSEAEGDLESVFIGYYKTYEKKQRIIKNSLVLNPAFADIMKNAKRTIEDVMISPVQRIPRYQLLLEALLKQLEKDQAPEDEDTPPPERDDFQLGLLRQGSTAEMLKSGIITDSSHNNTNNNSTESGGSTDSIQMDELFPKLPRTDDNITLIMAYLSIKSVAKKINENLDSYEKENYLLFLRQRLYGPKVEIPDNAVLLHTGRIYKINKHKDKTIMSSITSAARHKFEPTSPEVGPHLFPELNDPTTNCNVKKSIFICTNVLIYADHYKETFSASLSSHLKKSKFKFSERLPSSITRNIADFKKKTRGDANKKVHVSFADKGGNYTFFYTSKGIIFFSEIDLITKFHDDLIYVTKRDKSDTIFRSDQRDLWFDRMTVNAKRLVHFTEDTVDNENMGKKSSKACCIFKKAREVGESSSESDSDCDAEHHSCHGNAYDPFIKK